MNNGGNFYSFISAIVISLISTAFYFYFISFRSHSHTHSIERSHCWMCVACDVYNVFCTHVYYLQSNALYTQNEELTFLIHQLNMLSGLLKREENGSSSKQTHTSQQNCEQTPNSIREKEQDLKTMFFNLLISNMYKSSNKIGNMELYLDSCDALLFGVKNIRCCCYWFLFSY